MLSRNYPSNLDIFRAHNSALQKNYNTPISLMLAKNSPFDHNQKLQAKTTKQLTSNGQALQYNP